MRFVTTLLAQRFRKLRRHVDYQKWTIATPSVGPFLLVVLLFLISFLGPLVVHGYSWGDPNVGYFDRVERLIAEGKIVAKEKRQSNQPNGGVSASQLVLEYCPKKAQNENSVCGAEERAWYEASALPRDLKDLSIWKIVNGKVVSIDRTAHSFVPPNDKSRWNGSVLFAMPAEDEKSVRTVSLNIQGNAETHLVDLHSQSEEELPLEINFDPEKVLADKMTTKRKYAQADLIFDTKGKGPILKLRWAGTTDAPAVLVSIQDPGNGSPTIRPSAGKFWLTPSTPLEFELGSLNVNEKFTLKLSQPLEPILGSNAGGEVTKASSVINFANSLEHWLPSMVSSLRGDGSRIEDIHLTLSQELQASADTAIKTVSSRIWGQEPVSHEVFTTTIMNAQDGRILALASQAGPSPFKMTSDLETPLDPNFKLLQIGSTAKPIVSAAIIAANPKLKNLELESECVSAKNEGGSCNLKEILGFGGWKDQDALKVAFVNLDKDEKWNLRSFIKHSDNYFAAVLMLLTTIDPKASCILPSKGINLQTIFEKCKNQEAYHRPRSYLQNGISNNDMPYDSLSSKVHLFVEQMSALFSVNSVVSDEIGQQCSANPNEDVDLTANSLGGRGFDGKLWQSWLLSLKEDGWASSPQTICALEGVAPERENFNLDPGSESKKSFRTGLLPIILGGGDARWSTIGLAQAYSRLFLGKNVSATLTPSSPQVDPEEWSSDGLEARGALLPAMSAVSQGDGTAGRLFSVVENLLSEVEASGGRLAFFSKTGTPQLELPKNTKLVRLLNEMIRRGTLTSMWAPIADGETQRGIQLLVLDKNGKVWPAHRKLKFLPPELEIKLNEDARNCLLGADACDYIIRPSTPTRQSNGQVVARNLELTGSSVFGKTYVFVLAVYDSRDLQEAEYLSQAALPASGLLTEPILVKSAAWGNDNKEVKPKIAYSVAINFNADIVEDDKIEEMTPHLWMSKNVLTGPLRKCLTPKDEERPSWC